MTAPADDATIWDRQRIWVTLGAVALIFLGAIEALAVTTVMPIVSAALNGEALFAVAFAGTLATSVIGMVATGAWSDARGPRGALYVAVPLFIIGLLLSGFAVTMHQFLIGRLVQGLGTGGQTVALYVVVARLYPPTCTVGSSPPSPRHGSCRRWSVPSSPVRSPSISTGAGRSSAWRC